ncbi:Biopolymer transport protein ExbD/TolR [Candidatus Rhodobacter oscarellae]|uniref:Biopolymer transport protein ExbD/TolR n=1 Tax=Candidatus Rhodobacter oscarellae TaxID=1675527 RepID=A0A0J9E4Q3_9RHOB|nr:Biopolymer transport protein ExbD/TolR [Candidatus Rhodobacter lobularis]
MRLSRPARRRALSMTSLIDVIFLLLLFFMLSSTFSKFAEVELAAASAGGAAEGEAPKIAFLELDEARLRLDGQELALAQVAVTLNERAAEPTLVLVQVSQAATAQRLTDLLVALRKIDGLLVNVMAPT